MDACLKNYMIFVSNGALANYRLLIACDKAKFISSFQRHVRPSVPLKEFITAYSSN